MRSPREQDARSSRRDGALAACRSIPSMLMLASLAGCASATIEPNGTLVRHYLGYIKVAVPPAEARQPIYVSDVQVLGLRIGNGIGVGYARDRQIVVPLDCRLVLLLPAQSDLDAVTLRLSGLLGGANACAVINPSTD